MILSVDATPVNPEPSPEKLDAVIMPVALILVTSKEVRFKEPTVSYTLSLSNLDNLDLGDIVNLDEIDFTAFQSDSSQLKIEDTLEESKEVKLKSNLLRSNCRVTNQPDWGDVFIKIKGKKLPSAESLAKYIVSHRTVSHFHEEICEMVYKHLTDAYKPEQLMVACLYTRRGGLDINPVRASHISLLPDFFSNVDYRIAKTLRQ